MFNLFKPKEKLTATRYELRGGQEASIIAFNTKTGKYLGYIRSAGFIAKLRQPCAWNAKGVAMSKNRDLDIIC